MNVWTMVVFFGAVASRMLAADVVVNAKITHTGIDETQRPIFAVEAQVKNLSSNSVLYATMHCSWDESWRIEPDKYLAARGWDCLGNYPVKLPIEGGQSVTFRFHIFALAGTLPAEFKKVRLGFIAAPWPTRGLLHPGQDPVTNVFWSAYLDLPPVRTRFIPEAHEMK